MCKQPGAAKFCGSITRLVLALSLLACGVQPLRAVAADIDAVRVMTLPQALASSVVSGGDSGADGVEDPRAVAVGERLRREIARLRGVGDVQGATVSGVLPGARLPRVLSAKGRASALQLDGRNRRTAASAVANALLTAQGAARPAASHSRVLGQLRERLQKPIQARMRASGTPRQIRGAGRARLHEPAAAVSFNRDWHEQTSRAFLRNVAGLLRLDDPDSELRLTGKRIDELGRLQLRYAQQYRGIPVWGSGLVVHLDAEGHVDLMDGAFVPTPRKTVTRPAVSPRTALALARMAVGGAKHTPVGSGPEQVIYVANGEPRLAWKLTLQLSFGEHWLVIIDALNGATLNAFNEIMSANVAGSGVDIFGTSRDLNVWQQGADFFMVDTSKPMFDPTSTPPAPATTRGGIVIQDAQNQPAGDPFEQTIPLNNVVSTSATAGWLADAVSAAFGFSETYDYFQERHGRDSLDGNGGTIMATVRVGTNFSNAFFNSEQQAMFFGDAEPYAGALDVVAHELAHGVTSNTANLIYQNQSGALNEAFSDIFGTAVQARTQGVVDWLIGDQLGAGGVFRSLEAPGSLQTSFGPYPSKMSEFIITTEDNGGVHINSSIINHAFYLLVEGLPGAIGLQDAEQIFYRALTVHLLQLSQFVDARLACIQSAEELFGEGSPQALKTAEAFDAVEIFDVPPTPEPTPFPEVEGDDATLAVFFDPASGSYFLWRREQALGDGPGGVRLSLFSIAPGTRPAVSGDGSFAVFVDSINDICFIETDGQTAEDCLGFPGLVHSVSMSPGGDQTAFVLLDASGSAENAITVVDVNSGAGRTFTLVAPALDGQSTNSIVSADTMDFTSDGKLMIYDAWNVIDFVDGTQSALWSIYAIDLITERTLSLVPPVAGFDIGYPAFSQTSDNLITFDARDQSSGESTVLAANLNTGDTVPVATVTLGYGVPGYSGDDNAIVYSQYDPAQPTLYSLYRQPLSGDRVTPSGPPALWVSNADFGVIYRRGAFSGAVDVNLIVSQIDSPDPVVLGGTLTYTSTVSNSGSDTATGVVLTHTLPTGVDFVSAAASQGNCTGSASVSCELGVLAAGQSANVQVSVIPTVSGMITSAVNVSSSELDSDTSDNDTFQDTQVSDPGTRNGDLVIDFGAIGLWARMNDSAWLKLNNASPDRVALGDLDGNSMDEVIADFGSSIGGLFLKRNQGPWTKLHNSTAERIAVGDLDGNGQQDIVIDFGAIGLWARMNDASWLKLNNASPAQVEVADMDGNGADDVVAVFTSGVFVKRNLGAWLQLHNATPDALAAGDLDNSGEDDVIVDFGAIGLWARMNNAIWRKLHNDSPDVIAIGDVDGNGADDVVAGFGSTIGGTWQKVNLGGWAILNSDAPDELVTGDVDATEQDDIIAGFGSTIGGIFVKRNGGRWMKLHNLTPQSLAAGEIDGN